MGTYTLRKHSFREVKRLHALDQHGLQHTLVERRVVINDVGASGHVFDSAHGASHYYSATSGDAVARSEDGTLKTKDGKLVFDITLP